MTSGPLTGTPVTRRPPPPAWSLSARGVRTVYRWELRRGFRAASWNVRVAVWTAVVALLVAALGAGWRPGTAAGPSTLGVSAVALLALALTATPVLTAGAHNAEASLLRAPRSAWISAADAAVGALLAAWTNALLLPVAVTPFLIYAAVAGGTSAWQVGTSLAVVAVTLLVAVAVGLGWSAVIRRPFVGTLLTQGTLAALALGPLLLFGITQPLVTTDDQVRVYSVGADPDTGLGGACSREPRLVTTPQVHTEHTWWLLAPSPYVVLADAAPGRAVPGDVLAGLRDAIRGSRAGPDDVVDRCRDTLPPDVVPVWPYGLAALTGVGAAFVGVTVHRLRKVAGSGSGGG
jgi:hypothetical protein